MGIVYVKVVKVVPRPGTPITVGNPSTSDTLSITKPLVPSVPSGPLVSPGPPVYPVLPGPENAFYISLTPLFSEKNLFCKRLLPNP